MVMNHAAAALASMAIAITCAALALRLEIAPTYADFIVGHIAWRASTKLQDIVAVPVFAVALVLAFRCLGSIEARLRERQDTAAAAAFTHQLFYWSIPFLVVIGRVAGRSDFEPVLAAISALGLIMLAIAGLARNSPPAGCGPALAGSALLASLLFALAPFELALVGGRLAGYQVGGFGATQCLIAAGWIAGGCACAWLLVALRWPARVPELTRQMLTWSQIGLPFLFAVLYPARLKPADGAAIEYPTSFALKALIAGLIVWGVIDVLRRCSRAKFDGQAPWNCLSPIALIALAIALKVGNTVTPFISADDYHFGESLLGVWSYGRGAIPYVDYVPPHGLIDDDLPGLVSLLFYDGTAATFHESVRLSHALLAMVAFLFIHRFTGSLALAFASVMFLDGRLAWFFLVPFICIWLAPSWRERPQRWLMQWLITAPIVFLAVPPQGGLLIAASSLIALAAARAVACARDKRGALMIGATAAIVAAVLATPPLAAMTLGAVRYLLENGPINQVAYGIPWSLSWATPPQPQLLIELIRMSWIVLPVACLWVMTCGRSAGWPAGSARLPALVVFIFVMLLIPYAMGRIDPDRVSTRAGVFATLGWMVLLPVVLWPLLRAGQRAAFIATIALFGALLNFRPVSVASMASAVAAEIDAGILMNGPAAGMPKLGLAAVEEKHWARLVRVKAALDEHLAPGETYLDLSNRIAHYFYFDRRPPIPIAATFNLAAPAQQVEALKRIAAKPPPVLLVEADSVAMEDGRLALRAPLLYRYIVLNYMPVARQGLVLALHRSRASGTENLVLESAIKAITDDNWQAGVHRREAAIVVDNPVFAASIPVGTPLRLPGGEVRIVSRIWPEGAAIWFEGPRLEAGSAGMRGTVSVRMSPEETRLTLFERAFSHADLASIPIAWGRSAHSLLDHSRLVKRIDAGDPATPAKAARSGESTAIEPGPGVTLPIDQTALSGRDAGLLKFDFSCTGRKAPPRLRLTWWGDDQTGPADTSTLRFNAEQGALIVPVDSSPRWLLLNRVKAIRIGLENPDACATTRLSNIELRQRKGVD